MEEVLAYIFLSYQKIVTEDEYQNRLDELFLENPQNEDLLYLEWETDIEKAIAYIRQRSDCKAIDTVLFGRCCMDKIAEFYRECSFDIKKFASRMYGLWKILPDFIQYQEPFYVLSYADDPLSWGDEEQSRSIYERMMNYYNA